jgi:hypothetical protein
MTFAKDLGARPDRERSSFALAAVRKVGCCTVAHGEFNLDGHGSRRWFGLGRRLLGLWDAKRGRNGNVLGICLGDLSPTL